MGDCMEKMIIGLILSAAGGLGAIFSLGGLMETLNTVVGIPGWGLLAEPSLNLNIIIFIVSVVSFGIGIILINSDREMENLYGRY